MRKSWPYLVLLLGVLIFLGWVSGKTKTRQIDWSENYRMESKLPYGCFLTRTFLERSINSPLITTEQTLYTYLRDTSFRKTNFVFINDEFSPSGQDVIELCRFAEEGNTVFIAARDLGLLTDTLKVFIHDPIYDQTQDTSMTLSQAIQTSSGNVTANFYSPSLKMGEDAPFEREDYTFSFRRLKDKNVTILGHEGNGLPNFVKVDFGEGQFLLHSSPEFFGNYYAGREKSSEYLLRALSYLPDQPTLIDQYYKRGRVVKNDTRRYLLSQPALRLAYDIIIITGLIVLFFGGKRRQRPVPVVAPIRNTTLDFVEQIGALYYRQSDHGNIIRKKIGYFLESVRSRFTVMTIQLDDRLVDRVSALSGVSRSEVQDLFALIARLDQSAHHSAGDLKKLEQAIREFNQKSKR